MRVLLSWMESWNHGGCPHLQLVGKHWSLPAQKCDFTVEWMGKQRKVLNWEIARVVSEGPLAWRMDSRRSFETRSLRSSGKTEQILLSCVRTFLFERLTVKQRGFRVSRECADGQAPNYVLRGDVPKSYVCWSMQGFIMLKLNES